MRIPVTAGDCVLSSREEERIKGSFTPLTRTLPGTSAFARYSSAAGAARRSLGGSMCARNSSPRGRWLLKGFFKWTEEGSPKRATANDGISPGEQSITVLPGGHREAQEGTDSPKSLQQIKCHTSGA